MSNTAITDNLFGNANPIAVPRTGILPSQQIKNMIREKEIVASKPIKADQIQPASLDLRLGHTAYRVRASFLPGANSTVQEKVEQLDAYPIDISTGAVLEKGCVYVIKLQESLYLRNGIVGVANPKSSTGRLDILTRLISDKCVEFDRVERGYQGPLYVEVAPRTFSVVVEEGTKLNQIRFRRGLGTIAASEIGRLYRGGHLVTNVEHSATTDQRLVKVTIDLEGHERNGLIGFRAKKHTDRIDLACVRKYPAQDFWEPIFATRPSRLVLDPNDFYILVTRESVQVPEGLAAEMVAYDTSIGEFRVHYAGFFDPGFGCGGASSKAVLEVRSHEVPFMLEHGQTVGGLEYERMASTPDQLYGRDSASNYQGQGLALAKQFIPLSL